MLDQNEQSQTVTKLNRLFGSYKAEWLHESIYELFTEPTYFPELTTSRPCFLLGGRGAGKTTTLLGLSYHGQYAFSGQKAEKISGWPYFGIFYRVNTNRVSAFRGEELSEDKWIKLFAHYLNLLICDELAKFVEWYASKVPGFEALSAGSVKLISRSLCVDPAINIQQLIANIQSARVSLEGIINTVADDLSIPLSMQGAPIDLFFEQLRLLKEFEKKQFFVLIDEYENFEDYQQRVVNTLIKHSSPLYTFKVGVRELGFRCRTTLKLSEQLIHPSDYVRVNISEKLTPERFDKFAENVCQERLKSVDSQTVNTLHVRNLLPHLTPDEEAVYLDKYNGGAASHASQRLMDELGETYGDEIAKLSLLEQYFIVRRAIFKGLPLTLVWEDYTRNRAKWKTDFENHKMALLFTFGKTGSKNPKLYCGWKTFTSLAHSNIRYLLELVDQAIQHHVAATDDQNLIQPISFENQTEAAYLVGRKNLTELEGLSVDGAKLTKLLLGLGRVFQLLATNYYHDNPEVTQFCLPPEWDIASSANEATDQLLKAAVNHLALVRFRGTKLADDSETKEYDYMIHPIFSPFFVTSFRKKRKITVSSAQLLALVTNPKQAIPDILKARPDETAQSIPVQLELFKSYYESGN